MPHLIFEDVKPEADEAAQLLSLSDRIRKGELSLVIDISADALRPRATPPRNRSTFIATLRAWTNRASAACRRERWSAPRASHEIGDGSGSDSGCLREMSRAPASLLTKDPVDRQDHRGRQEKSSSGRARARIPGGPADDRRSRSARRRTWGRWRKTRCSGCSKCCCVPRRRSSS